MAYLNAARPALLAWSANHDHLRETTRDEVLAYLADLCAEPRMIASTGLRSLFGWAKRNGVIVRDPCARIRQAANSDASGNGSPMTRSPPHWHAADTPAARLCVALAAFYAARPRRIRVLHVDDVDQEQSTHHFRRPQPPARRADRRTAARMARPPTHPMAAHRQSASVHQ
ncbi:hypothetical protein [Nocardia sp. CC227C]|uniref:hypothetical protein n=1 Tax=Nocardia sp. CC227C TaxID=3044562 RepID=UPI00278BFD53|nr:hypothetical protein [Nocardia sp. CC227C]